MQERERLERTVEAIAQNRYGVARAAAGWLYAARYEHRFIDADLQPRIIRRRPRALTPFAEPEDLARAASSHLTRLLELPDVSSLHAALEELALLDAPSCTLDDHFDPSTMFPNDRLGVVIIGAGPIGLALASALRLALGPSVNVLVVEDRVSSPHHKLPYDRRWLTLIGHEKLVGIVEDPVREILARVGSADHIGVTMRILETLLLLSCRRLGVRFLFASEPDLSVIGALPVDLVFDATGNRLRPLESTGPFEINERLDTETVRENDAVLASYGIDVRATAVHSFVEVASTGALQFPLHHGRRMAQAMIKLVGFPARMCDAILRFVIPRNEDNRFYVWRGSLHDEVNEGLVIINLTRAEYDALCAAHEYPLALADAIASPAFDVRTRELLALVAEQATNDARIELDAPFLWRPYRIDPRTLETLHGKPVVRVGDSIYNGNVKIANGMGPHLLHVAHIQKMLWAHATSAHADLIARSMGSRSST